MPEQRQGKSGAVPLWTPQKKLDDRVKRLAMILFIEQWKATFMNRQIADEWNPELVYRNCVKNAIVVVLIEDEDVKHG